MPRNPAGVYTLPDPPRVPGTTIDAPDENTTRDDMAAELTNSLDRQGRGGMLAPFRIADGVLAAPGLAFLNDPDNGLYRIGADSWALAAGGTQILTLSTLGASLAGSWAVSGDINVGGNINIPGTATVGALTVTGPATLNNTLVLNGQHIIQASVAGLTEISVNFVGFNNGITEFRDFVVYDGKQVPLFKVNGTNKNTQVTGSLVAGGVITNSTSGGGFQMGDAGGTQRISYAAPQFDFLTAIDTLANIRANAIITAGGIVTTSNTNPLQLATLGGVGLQIMNVPNMVNQITIYGGAAGSGFAQIFATGTDPNVSMVLSSQGAGGIIFYTGGGGQAQVSITHTPGAINQVVLTGGSVSTYPTVSASAGPLVLGSKIEIGPFEISSVYRCEIQTFGAGAVPLLLKTTTYESSCSHLWNAGDFNDNYFANFYTEPGATLRGSITYNRAGGVVAFNTTSDYRAKELKGDYVGASALLKNLKVHLGRMKGATMERPMLVAHEAQYLTPWTVTGEKDAVDEDGKPVFQQMNEGGFTPLLIAGWQALEKRISQLEGKVLQ